MNAVHFILYVRDQQASTEFYSAALELEPVLNVPGMTEFRLGGNTLLGLMPETGASRLLNVSTTGNGDPRAEFYLVVDDPAAAHARALAAGARELSPLTGRDWGHEVAYSIDPDGHVIAFARAV